MMTLVTNTEKFRPIPVLPVPKFIPCVPPYVLRTTYYLPYRRAYCYRCARSQLEQVAGKIDAVDAQLVNPWSTDLFDQG